MYYLYLTEEKTREKNQSLVFDGADYQNKTQKPILLTYLAIYLNSFLEKITPRKKNEKNKLIGTQMPHM